MILIGKFHLQQLKGLREITEWEAAQSNLYSGCFGDYGGDPQASKTMSSWQILLQSDWFPGFIFPPHPLQAEDRVPEPHLHLDGTTAKS